MLCGHLIRLLWTPIYRHYAFVSDLREKKNSGAILHRNKALLLQIPQGGK